MKVNLQDTVKVEAKETALVVKQEVSKTEAKVEATSYADKIPSNWTITEIEHGIIEAYNNATMRKFSGNLQDFNKMLRG